MNRQYFITILLTTLMSMIGVKAFAREEFQAVYKGKTIYYAWTNNNTELAVTHRGWYFDQYSDEYTGNVEIPKSVDYNGNTYPVTSIGEDAFDGCSGLTSITIPNSVTSIGDYAFDGCSGLTSVHISDLEAWCGINFRSNPLEYAHHLYLNGEEIKDLVIPSSVTSIGGAFDGCSGLTSITVENGNQYYDSRNNCNAIITKSTNVLIRGCKNTIIPNSVTSIGVDAFCHCDGLTSITIPNGVTTIGMHAFWKCTGLTSITIPNSVTSIGSLAFRYCSGLTTIKSEIEDPFVIEDVFYSSDKDIYSTATLIVPKGKKSAYNSTEGWKKFKYIVEEGEFVVDDIYYKIDENNTASVIKGNRKYSGDIVIPAYVNYDGKTYNVTSIGEWAFYGCNGLTSITIPNSVTSIGMYAFDGCSGLTSVHISDIKAWCGIKSYSSPLEYAHHLYLNGEEIKDLVIPNSVTSIGGSAFNGCSGLTSLLIPNSVTSIGNSAFSDCSGLTSVTIPNSVTSIAEFAFSGCSGLTSVTIPNSVTSIGDATFSGCSGLLSIKVESGNIKYDSRNDCNAIIEKSSQTLIAGCKNTIIPNSVTSIGESAFSGCSGLTSMVIPNSVTSIGIFAFNRCSGLTSITIPRSVTSIGERIFEYCSGLTSIKVESGNQYYDSRNDCNAIIETSSNTLIAGCKSTIIPISVTSVGRNSFRSRSTLTSITIPNSVTSIGGYAFRNCSGLTSVTIPNSVTSIGLYAFENCSSLTTIVSKIDNPYEIDIDLFYSDLNDIYSTATLYVPAGKKAAYEATVGWKKFNNIKEIIDGDVNLDEKVNKDDQGALVAHIMGEKPEGFYEGLADLNGDDDVNAADVVKLVDILNSVGLSTDSQVDFDNVDGNLVVSALTCTLNNERDEAIQLKECELLLNGNLVSSRTFSGSSANMAAGANKSCSFGNLTRFATRTGFSVLWHYTVNGEAFVYRCPLTD